VAVCNKPQAQRQLVGSNGQRFAAPHRAAIHIACRQPSRTRTCFIQSNSQVYQTEAIGSQHDVSST
jgi:hypothetical protein